MSIPEFIYTVLLKPPPLRRLTNLALRAILPPTIKLQGAIIHLNPSDPVISGALALGVYEKDEIDFFTKWFEPGMTFVDIGANVGLYTGLALAGGSRETTVLCIEPDKDSLNYLLKTIRSNQSAEEESSVTVRNLAASDSKAEITLHKNPENKGDNRIYSDPLCNQRETIHSDTLDNICKDLEIQCLNFVKADVQGAEFKVFSGARSVLLQSPDCILMTEFWPYGLARCGSSPSEYLTLLQDLGFTLYELAGKNLKKIEDFERLISKTPGRIYRNLVGLKGKFVIY